MLLRVIFSLNLMLATVAAAFTLPIFAYSQLPTDRLKAYRSEAGAFEVTYPIDWSTAAEEKGDSLVVFFTSPRVRDDDVFQAARIMVCSTPIDGTTWNDCTERDSHLSDLYKDSVRSRKEFFVNGLKLKRVGTVSKYDDAFFYYARFSSSDRRFFVRGDFKESFNLDRYAPVFDKILESFSILSEAKPISACRGLAGTRPLW
jgi:hypothetical protein